MIAATPQENEMVRRSLKKPHIHKREGYWTLRKQFTLGPNFGDYNKAAEFCIRLNRRWAP